MISKEEMTKILDVQMAELRAAGFDVVMKALFEDDFLIGIQSTEKLTIEQVIERYSYLLSEDQINRLKILTKK